MRYFEYFIEVFDGSSWRIIKQQDTWKTKGEIPPNIVTLFQKQGKPGIPKNASLYITATHMAMEDYEAYWATPHDIKELLTLSLISNEHPLDMASLHDLLALFPEGYDDDHSRIVFWII